MTELRVYISSLCRAADNLEKCGRPKKDLVSWIMQAALHDVALAEILNASPDGVMLVGADGRIAFVNEVVVELFGFPAAELVGQAIETLVPGRFRRRHMGLRNGYMKSPTAFLSPSGGVRSGFNPSLFSDASCGAIQI